MCFHSQLTLSAQSLEKRFRARFVRPEGFLPGVFNGFQHPFTPVITHTHPELIQLYQWGLIPHWARNTQIQQNTLNARIETIGEKPSFRDVTQHRCLVISDGFFEWQWLDVKGKQKKKYLLRLPDGEAFGFAGLWSEWTDRLTGEIIPTYTILTTEAEGLMAEIHNSKQRMPIILSAEQDWLSGGGLQMQNHRLEAHPM